MQAEWSRHTEGLPRELDTQYFQTVDNTVPMLISRAGAGRGLFGRTAAVLLALVIRQARLDPMGDGTYV